MLLKYTATNNCCNYGPAQVSQRKTPGVGKGCSEMGSTGLKDLAEDYDANRL